ncbi:MAG: RidA family protein [Acidobacteriota bacterium]
MTIDKIEVINPSELADPIGYSNGLCVRGGGDLLFIAGQIGWNKEKRLVGDRFAAQFEQALVNVLAVVQAAGGTASNIGKMTIYVTDKREYLAELKEIGSAYRQLMGKHYPAMALVEVRALLEPSAKVEIEAIAVL